MEWWEWIALAVILGLAVAGAFSIVLRSTARGRRFLGLPHLARIRFGRILLSDPATPLPAKVALIVLVGYLLLPFDIIPDFLPIIGTLDDAVIASLLIAFILAFVPRADFELALSEAEEGGERQV